MLLGLAHTLCPICRSFGTVPNFHTKKRRIDQGNSSRPIAFSFTRGISSTPWGFVCVERNQWYSTFISKLYFYCRRSCGVQKFFTLSYDLLRRGQQCSVQHIKKLEAKTEQRSSGSYSTSTNPRSWFQGKVDISGRKAYVSVRRCLSRGKEDSTPVKMQWRQIS